MEWDENENDINKCKECWGKTDLDNYSTWPGSGSYIQAAIEGRADPPFQKDLANNNACKLNCKDHYWSNWKSNAFPGTLPNEQHCTSDNCRTWDPAAASNVGAKTCVDCWEKADMDTYGDWDGRKSYT
jgi:hypothetical protein